MKEKNQPVKIGCSFATQVKIPASSAPQDIEAGRKMMHGVINKDLWNNSWWMDPVLLGNYPEDGLKLFGKDAPKIKPGDMELIHQPIDYCGYNVYTARRCIDVKAYFTWTLLDNFEWSFGYRVRVGLVYTDYKTLERIPKDSYKWYRDMIASNGENL